MLTQSLAAAKNGTWQPRARRNCRSIQRLPFLLPARLHLGPAPLLHLRIVPPAVPTRNDGSSVHRPEQEAEAVVARNVRNIDIGRRGPSSDKAALRLVVQHRDEFGAVIGLAAQRLVGNDDRG